MKKALLLFIAFYAAQAAMLAQDNATQESLEGNWQFVSYTDGEEVYDLEKHVVRLTEEGKKHWDAEGADGIARHEEWLTQQWLNSGEQFNEGLLTFKGNTIGSFVDGYRMMGGTYAINAAGTGITVNQEDGVVQDVNVVIKGDILYINGMDGMDYVLRKKQ